MSDYGIIEREVVIMILCFLALAALALSADHIIQAWWDLFVEIAAAGLTTILRLSTYMESS